MRDYISLENYITSRNQNKSNKYPILNPICIKSVSNFNQRVQELAFNYAKKFPIKNTNTLT
ncbi:hypothetical protein BpHYR1_014206 [Brachionus plicatilis]|uniref:Uncharacterized protein n=1 Tax=Brachionus plicatilis TaxID=10195 RepID=A0A3M7S9V9_BRAPC|nr:hypothetical protein BpHYR1_014206 [Brachionus plicatilis]